jgi:hypothetical protein
MNRANNSHGIKIKTHYALFQTPILSQEEIGPEPDNSAIPTIDAIEISQLQDPRLHQYMLYILPQSYAKASFPSGHSQSPSTICCSRTPAELVSLDGYKE